ncbi:MAG: ATP-binding protein [Ginsengibacter sp.]
MEFKFLINSKGHLRQRESYDLEFKQAFHFESINFYLRSLAGMANNRGGQIIFGIKDSPHLPEGLKNDKFKHCDPKIINEKMLEFFSHAFDWSMNTIEYDGKYFGQIWVPESNNKPILCRKNHEKGKLREGAIYFRYRGETKEIAYPELYKLIETEKEKEKKLWMEHVQKISSVGPRNIQVLDLYNGEMEIGENKILLDKELLKKIKFIKEGHFTEKKGAPALIVKGHIAGIVDNNQILSSDVIYPLLTGDLIAQTGLNSHHVKCLLWKFKIKGDKRYHSSVKTGKKSEVHKYSKTVLEMLNRYKSKEGFLEKVCSEYSNEQKTKVNKKRK